MITWRRENGDYIGKGDSGKLYFIRRDYTGGEHGYRVFAGGESYFFGTLKMAKQRAESKEKATPKSNPITTAEKVAKAKKLRAGFRYTAGGRKNQKSTVRAVTENNTDDVRVIIGVVEAIEYTVLGKTGKRLKDQSFRHEFTGKSCPQLATSYDGRQLYIVGGRYKFKTDGINDE